MRISDWSSDVCSSDLGASTTLELSTDPDMRLRVEHITHYQYDSPVRYALQQAKLTPKERPGQQLIHGWTIAIEGGAQQLHYTDHHGNGVDLNAVNGGTSELVIRCTGEVELVTWDRAEEHTSELQSLMPTSYAVICLKKKK